MAGHNKVFGICENKCLVEVLPKAEAATKREVEQTQQEIINALKAKPYTFINDVFVSEESRETVIIEIPNKIEHLTKHSILIQNQNDHSFTEINIIVLINVLPGGITNYIFNKIGNIDVYISDYNFDDVNDAWFELTIVNSSSNNAHTYNVFFN